jgi:hypothetical protein
MPESEWNDVAEKLPWRFVAVMVQLMDGQRMQAVWTGHMWWGEGRELRVAAWKPIDGLLNIAA